MHWSPSSTGMNSGAFPSDGSSTRILSFRVSDHEELHDIFMFEYNGREGRSSSGAQLYTRQDLQRLQVTTPTNIE